MLKTISATCAAALLAGTFFVVPGLIAPVAAKAPQGPLTVGKGDRLDLKSYGSDCSERSWPYFEATCLRNPATPSRHVRAVRLITTDRLD
jgi:hypothetical protein